ncbi:MAG: ribbon-helix-helix domain-containing protein [Candidatus Nomurabacteria bacterium]|jgi:metal-responsive CopG/Arc/MetJ family transcriptional regulator|nr:ribbon-helix-helix domain-containing protein [Candidatus Nomurabacteria bacterium]
MSNNTVTINLSLPQALVERVDLRAKEDYTSRSDIFRTAVLHLLREDADWRTVFNDKDGVPVDDFLVELRRFDDGQNK